MSTGDNFLDTAAGTADTCLIVVVVAAVVVVVVVVAQMVVVEVAEDWFVAA